MSTSAGNPTSWSPYDSYKDCSQRICSIYCPQWCYIIFPPPPPFEFRDDDSGSSFSPLIIAVIGILGSAFLLVSYFTIISKYCKGRNDNNDPQNLTSELEANQNQMTHDQSQQQNQEVAINGLDESLINSITVFKYKKGDGLIGGVVDCAVCLSEFQENESLRLLPKCIHAFHVPCIDKWLMSHSNCPLCRSNVVPISPPLPLQSGSSTTLNVNSLEIGRQSDLVLVIDDRVHQEEVFDAMVDHEIVQEIRRSNSSGSFSCHRNILIADILNNSEDEADLQVENCESQVGNGPDKLKRSNSMGRFVSSGLDKERIWFFPTENGN